MEKYKYQPLEPNQIRLIQLDAGTGDEILSCRLISYNFSDRWITYTALSYCWGNPTFSEVLYCPEALSVTPSLQSALKRLRHKSLTILVWADAACINQTDINEKNEQVPMMNKMNCQAGRVAVFLGAESDDSHLIPAYIDWKGNQTFPGSFSNSPERNSQAEHAFDMLFQRPWSTRVWVIQEVVLAAAVDVLCGSWILSFHDIVAGLRRHVAQPGYKRTEEHLLSSTTFSIANKQCLLMEQLQSGMLREERDQYAFSSIWYHQGNSIQSEGLPLWGPGISFAVRTAWPEG